VTLEQQSVSKTPTDPPSSFAEATMLLQTTSSVAETPTDPPSSFVEATMLLQKASSVSHQLISSKPDVSFLNCRVV
jgi:hypothetical protein